MMTIVLADALLDGGFRGDGVEGGDHDCLFGGSDEVMDEGEAEIGPAVDGGVSGVNDRGWWFIHFGGGCFLFSVVFEAATVVVMTLAVAW